MAIDPEGAAKDSGQIRLEELEYKQELSRRLGLVSSVASSFATIAYMMGITGQRSPLRPIHQCHLLPPLRSRRSLIVHQQRQNVHSYQIAKSHAPA